MNDGRRLTRVARWLALPLAAAGWWGIYLLTSRIGPERPLTVALFFLLLFLTLTATLALPAAYVNRRFAPAISSRAPGRFLRHSAWGGLYLTTLAWLQMHRALTVWFALIIALIFLALEVLVVRLRGEYEGATPDEEA